MTEKARKRRRSRDARLFLTEIELADLDRRAAEAGIRSRSFFMRKILAEGRVLKLGPEALAQVAECALLARRAADDISRAADGAGVSEAGARGLMERADALRAEARRLLKLCGGAA